MAKKSKKKKSTTATSKASKKKAKRSVKKAASKKASIAAAARSSKKSSTKKSIKKANKKSSGKSVKPTVESAKAEAKSVSPPPLIDRTPKAQPPSKPAEIESAPPIQGKPVEVPAPTPAPVKPEPTPAPPVDEAIVQIKRADPILLEVGWEVCNKLGGIYTVLRTKVPSMMARWGKRYCLVGPYNHDTAQVEFEPAGPEQMDTPVGQAVQQMREMGYGVEYGHWLVTGRPQAVLLHVGDEAAHEKR